MTQYPELLERLRAGRDEFLFATEGVTASQASAKPAIGGWSILECVEHVAIVEVILFHLVANGSTPLPGGPKRNMEARILARGLDRARKFEAPEGVRPTGRFGSLGDALGAFRDARTQSIAWVERCNRDLRQCSVLHPAFGQVSGYEMVLFAAMHPMRHALQIRELRGQLRTTIEGLLH